MADGDRSCSYKNRLLSSLADRRRSQKAAVLIPKNGRLESKERGRSIAARLAASGIKTRMKAADFDSEPSRKLIEPFRRFEFEPLEWERRRPNENHLRPPAEKNRRPTFFESSHSKRRFVNQKPPKECVRAHGRQQKRLVVG